MLEGGKIATGSSHKKKDDQIDSMTYYSNRELYISCHVQGQRPK